MTPVSTPITSLLNVSDTVKETGIGGIGSLIVTVGGVSIGLGLITTFPDCGEVQPDELLTVKLYVPGSIHDIIVLVPVPVDATFPGIRVIVQVPEAGSPVKTTLPKESIHVGWVIAPTTGADGADGAALIATFPEADETQPDELVTVKVYVPGTNPEIVVLAPVPDVVTPPGYLVKVHDPEDGKPLNTTLPVAIEQVGWVIAPTIGAVGADGAGLVTTFPEDGETQPDELVTVKVYVPGNNPETVVLAPVPDVVTPPGFFVKVHDPEDGKPLNSTLPVATEQVGWVIAPTTSADGTVGAAFIPTFAEADEIQPDELVTVKVYVPGNNPEIVMLAPVPDVVTPPGVRVNVQDPEDGKPLNTTLPVATEHVGCVIAPTIGAVGADGAALITTSPEDGETQPDELVTVNV